jgi:hypothetical protein
MDRKQNTWIACIPAVPSILSASGIFSLAEIHVLDLHHATYYSMGGSASVLDLATWVLVSRIRWTGLG